jgi:hypothetical protein
MSGMGCTRKRVLGARGFAAPAGARDRPLVPNESNFFGRGRILQPLLEMLLEHPNRIVSKGYWAHLTKNVLSHMF